MRLALLLLPLPLLAADLQVNDLRIEIGKGEVQNFDGTIHYKEGANSAFATQTITDDEWDGGSPLALSALYSRGKLDPAGFVWAIGVEYQTSESTAAGETFKTDLLGAKARAGIGFSPADGWRIEATAEGQLGIVSGEDADLTASDTIDRADTEGTFQAIGLQVGAGYAIKGKWEIGASFRVLGYSAQVEADFDQTGGSYDADYSWVFWSAAVTGGVRF